jgi:hypothetical protein
MVAWLSGLHIHHLERLLLGVVLLHQRVVSKELVGVKRVIGLVALIGLIYGLVQIVADSNLALQVAVDSFVERTVCKARVQGVDPAELHGQIVVLLFVHLFIHHILLPDA